jgi:hypothetical protein
VIDIKNVRELAAAKEPRVARLADFLDEIGAAVWFVERIVPELLPALEAYRASIKRLEAVESWHWLIIGDHFGRLWTEHCMPIDPETYEWLEEIAMEVLAAHQSHHQFVFRQLRTGKPLNDKRRKISERLQRAAKVFSLFLSEPEPPDVFSTTPERTSGSRRRLWGKVQKSRGQNPDLLEELG